MCTTFCLLNVILNFNIYSKLLKIKSKSNSLNCLWLVVRTWLDFIAKHMVEYSDEQIWLMKKQIDLIANILFSIVEYRFMNRTTIRLKFLFILFGIWCAVIDCMDSIKWSVGHIWKRTKWLIRLDCFVNNQI